MSVLFPASPRRLAGIATRPAVRRRVGEVVAVHRLTPRLRRVVFGGPEMADFASAAPDDHVKLFFDDTDGTSVGRDYTPRRFDSERGELSIDFVLHGDTGPASRWASRAASGQRLTIGGPRRSRPVPAATDWLLIGDETALPSIARRLEELPPDVAATVLIEVADGAGELPLSSAAAVRVLWRHRDGRAPGMGDLLDRALESVVLAQPGLHVWIAAEIAIARRLRTHLVVERGIARDRIQAAGYWRLGVPDGAQRIVDEPSPVGGAPL